MTIKEFYYDPPVTIGQSESISSALARAFQEEMAGTRRIRKIDLAPGKYPITPTTYGSRRQSYWMHVGQDGTGAFHAEVNPVVKHPEVELVDRRKRAVNPHIHPEIIELLSPRQNTQLILAEHFIAPDSVIIEYAYIWQPDLQSTPTTE